MVNFWRMVALAMAFGCANTSLAQTVGETTVSTGVSTLGINIELAYQSNPSYRVRGALMRFPDVDAFDDSFDNGGTTYAYDAAIGGIAAFVDYYPSGAGWRVSGGLVLSQTEFNGTAELTAGNIFTLDDGTVIDTGIAVLETTFEQQLAPIATVGYDYSYENWVFGAELGAIYIGGLDLDASSTNARLQAEINDDADIISAREDGADVQFLPYVSFTIGTRF